jgi:hypothetical protein
MSNQREAALANLERKMSNTLHDKDARREMTRAIEHLVTTIVDEAIATLKGGSEAFLKSTASVRGSELEWTDLVQREVSSTIDVKGKRYIEVDFHNAVIRQIRQALGVDPGGDTVATAVHLREAQLRWIEASAERDRLKDAMGRISKAHAEISHALGNTPVTP